MNDQLLGLCTQFYGHLFNFKTQAEKHLHIRQDAEQKYMVMLERACKMLVEQMVGCAITNSDGEDYHQVIGRKTSTSGTSPIACGLDPSESNDIVRVQGSQEYITRINPQGADCSTESCLTSHDSTAGATLDGSLPGGEGKKRILSRNSASPSIIWS